MRVYILYGKCSHKPEDEYEQKNALELLDQAATCDQIANWLEELIKLRNDKHKS